MRVAEGVSLFVTYCFEELVDPDGGIDGKTGFIEGFELGGTGAGREDGPKTCNTHIWRMSAGDEIPESRVYGGLSIAGRANDRQGILKFALPWT